MWNGCEIKIKMRNRKKTDSEEKDSEEKESYITLQFAKIFIGMFSLVAIVLFVFIENAVLVGKTEVKVATIFSVLIVFFF